MYYFEKIFDSLLVKIKPVLSGDEDQKYFQTCNLEKCQLSSLTAFLQMYIVSTLIR